MHWGLQAILAGPAANVVLLASWVVLPAIFVGCWRQSVVARRITSDFSLHTLESIELSRATLLYQRAFSRLEQINKLIFDRSGSFRTRNRRRAELRGLHGQEFADLTAYAQHLQATVIRIRRQPLQRFTKRAHALSLRFALSSALAIYGAVFLLLLVLVFSSKPVWMELLIIKYQALLAGRSIGELSQYANLAASSVVILATPLFYLARRATFSIGERAQIRLLKQFAAPSSAWLFHHTHDHAAGEGTQGPNSEQQSLGPSWTAVLGVSPSATIEEIKEAYKLKIKQNHPDRVHGMAAIFSRLAEAETKKLNAAYEEAVLSAGGIAD